MGEKGLESVLTVRLDRKVKEQCGTVFAIDKSPMSPAPRVNTWAKKPT